MSELQTEVGSKSYQTLLGDCETRLKTLESNSVDSLVTDPPAGISFMGKEWDSDKGGRDGWVAWMASVMRECMRVMKPGAHGLVWAIPRTSHWTATALEDAGFEIRDVVTHLFGQGFPKSLDISKAIDKAAGAEREVVGSKGYSAEGEREACNITAPSTDAAKTWQGWGTALKPASEHWILVRKPCSEKTVAANVLKWSTGGINIDGSRVGTSETLGRMNHARPGGPSFLSQLHREDLFIDSSKGLGRFPANLVLSHSEFCTDAQCDIECAVKALDGQSGISASSQRTGKRTGVLGEFKGQSSVEMGHSDSGGASRFFYCAKISSRERGEDNRHPTVKPKKLMGYLINLITPPGGLVLDPFMGSGSTGLGALEMGFRFIGIEREPEYHAIAGKRLEGAQA